MLLGSSKNRGRRSVPRMVVGQHEPGSPPVNRGRLQSLALIVIFDVVGPLVAYYVLRSVGMSTVASLVLSGVVPAFGIAFGVVRHRRVDTLGVLVLIGIAVGTVLGFGQR